MTLVGQEKGKGLLAQKRNVVVDHVIVRRPQMSSGNLLQQFLFPVTKV